MIILDVIFFCSANTFRFRVGAKTRCIHPRIDLCIFSCFSVCFFFSRFFTTAAFTSVFAELFVRFGCLVASINCHKALLIGILHAPLTYFDQTPSGRILSRFSKDIDVVDVGLPEIIKWLLYCATEVIFGTFSFFKAH